MSRQTKVLGVIGGLGPAATLDFFDRIINKTNALRDQDHLRVIIDNNPRHPDRNAAAAGLGPSPGPSLALTAHGLEAAGAEIIVMACNAAHAYAAEIRSAITVPFLSMIEETATAVKARVAAGGRVGVLAADATLAAHLYRDALRARGLEEVRLSDRQQAVFMEALYRIKSGDLTTTREPMRMLAHALVDQGAEAVLAGCTEVPLALSAATCPAPLISSTDVLVERAILSAGGELRT